MCRSGKGSIPAVPSFSLPGKYMLIAEGFFVLPLELSAKTINNGSMGKHDSQLSGPTYQGEHNRSCNVSGEKFWYL